MERRKRRDMLKDYYSSSEDPQAETFDPYNINGSDFNPDLFYNKLLKEYNLNELLEKETDIYQQIQRLDSEMQTLVYENYNKFISATDTIRKMKHDFKKMEEEMDLLSSNMMNITDFSKNISSTLQGRREKISKLSGTHNLLHKLQFLFELPPRLKECIENKLYGKAVRQYLQAEQVLCQYKDMPSFRGIQEDCDAILFELKTKLREEFQVKEDKELAECVEMLLQLNEPADELCDIFISHSSSSLELHLAELNRQIKLQNGEIAPRENYTPTEKFTDISMDLLEFVDYGCNYFLTKLSKTVESYQILFLTQAATKSSIEEEGTRKKLDTFVLSLMEFYFQAFEKRVYFERDPGNNSVLVRAVDRFYRKLLELNGLSLHLDFSSRGMDLVSEAATARCRLALSSLCRYFTDCLTDVRQNLATSGSSPGSSSLLQVVPSAGSSTSGGGVLGDLLSAMEYSMCEQVRKTLDDLRAFIQPDLTFSTKTNFRNQFCQNDVREGLIVGFLRYINSTIMEFSHGSGSKSSPSGSLVLLLSKFAMDMETTTITYLLSLVDEKFVSEYEPQSFEAVLCPEFKASAQALLDCFVRLQGLTLSQMLRKSVETRDWMSTIEPRNVRAVMKRVVEDMTALDSQVGQLYEEGQRRERSSDSSRRTFPFSSSRQQAIANRSNWSAYTPSVDNSLISNIQKLFSEKIEIFSKVEFSKVSVMTGIIKISLKTFLECVRLRTFSRNGLQQVQVDTHYLQLYLWRFVNDENLVHVLLDEIVGSSIHRCIDPVMMESSVVEVICDRG